MNTDTKANEQDDLQKLAKELRRKQSNLLPPDLIANDRDMNDVLWNGPTRHCLVQRIGAFIIGITLFSCGLAAASILYQVGGRLWLIPLAAIAAAGLRVMYKSVKVRAG